MFDTMTVTKIFGGLCGALLVFLLGKFAADMIYYGGGHGEEAAQGYMIATDSGDDGGAQEESGPSFEEVYASADAGKGERVFNKCKACHNVDGTDTTGPHLDGVVGRPVDSVEGYAYSGALEKVADVWTPENLSGFLENPAGFAPGTKMGFAGLSKIEDRANVIAYLDSLGS
ncbi:cytochrome c family protein [Roseovarius spongiae]|uniref:Cytochrome c family protein n=1 Tax=Roseovarius spongiae TaxID=2320272 RepID=A0A3A8B969_9RHOB|nr:cytochrome c family protein [Roseovarius spongiae]RKF14603.1 cytochrome c family protein [Roseovarius spongiae]